MKNEIPDIEKQIEEGEIIRPAEIDEFIGQKGIIENLKVYLKAASVRNEPLDHTLFSGPPGLGKTTLARIIASSQKGLFHQIAAPNLKKTGDLVKLLMNLKDNDTLFIDEIHRLSAPLEEVLYTAMEDRQIDITLAEGMAASSIQIEIPPFTLVGATTRPGSLSAPLRDRFGIHLRLDFYEYDDIEKIIERAASIWKIKIDSDSVNLIARRSRMTPRVALQLLRRIWDFAIAHHEQKSETIISTAIARNGFESMEIDELGLTRLDTMFLKIIAENYHGGPVGLKPISVTLAEDITTLENFIEPYILRLALIQRTPRGRVITSKGLSHIGQPAIPRQQGGLFDEK